MTGIAEESGVHTKERITPLRLRRALGAFATGITVVTTAQGGGAHRDEPHGMTVNSFTSVSLDPPLVLVSIAKSARMNSMIAEQGRYGVSVLAAHQALLSRRFSGPTGHAEPVDFTWRDGIPLLAGSLLQLACSVHAVHRAGDHMLYVGKVESLTHQGEDRPLLFYAGEYRELWRG